MEPGRVPPPNARDDGCEGRAYRLGVAYVFFVGQWAARGTAVPLPRGAGHPSIAALMAPLDLPGCFSIPPGPSKIRCNALWRASRARPFPSPGGRRSPVSAGRIVRF